MRTLRSLPLGARMPDSVHAVTCSLPTMADVIGYEEKRPETLARIQSGYPRFVTHHLVDRVAGFWRERFSLNGRDLFVLPSEKAATEVRDYCRKAGADAEMLSDAGLFALHCPAGSPAAPLAAEFIRHVGCGTSSRRAEDYLVAQGLLDTVQPEETIDPAVDPGAEVAEALGAAFGSSSRENVLLAASGMNAFYATFRALDEVQSRRGRDIWIQFGWLYVDTIEILRKMTGGPGSRAYFADVFDLDKLESFLKENGSRVAALVTEMPGNPKVETPRADQLKELADRYGFAIVADPSLASPCNVDILPFADIAINSLTKYAANEGDAMAGAAVLNPASPWTSEVRQAILRVREPLYARDAARIAFEMKRCREFVRIINSNTNALVSRLQTHPSVKRVLWAREERSVKNFDRIAAREKGPGAIVTIELNIPLKRFYNALPVMKGPSFGTVFTLACPFMYLAHYDLVSTHDGRRRLRADDLDPDLVRISVGTEPAGDIVAAFEEALDS